MYKWRIRWIDESGKIRQRTFKAISTLLAFAENLDRVIKVSSLR